MSEMEVLSTAELGTGNDRFSSDWQLSDPSDSCGSRLDVTPLVTTNLSGGASGNTNLPSNGVIERMRRWDRHQ